MYKMKKCAKNLKQKLIVPKGEIDKSTIIVRTLSTLLSGTDRKTRQKIFKVVEELNKSVNHWYLTNVSVALHPTTAECKFFSEKYATIYHIGP
jgi:ribosomal protein S24E